MNLMKKTFASSLVLAATLAASAMPAAAAPDKAAVKVVQSTAVKSQVLNLPKGRSAVIDLPADAADVFVSNPAVADAVLRTPRRIFVLGVDAGQSDAIFFDAAGRQILNLQIRVDASTDHLADAVARLFPDSKVEVQSLAGKVVLSGMARNNGEADQILRLAQGFAGKPEDVVNLISTAGKDQVTLKVRIVEVNRTTIKQLGLASDITYNNGTRSYSYGRPNSWGANGKQQGGGGPCYSQRGTRTNDLSSSNTTTNNNSVTNELTETSRDMLTTEIDNGTQVYSTITNTAGNGPAVDSTNTTSSTIGSAITSAISTTYQTLTGTNTDACLVAFERVGLARVLAEPNLTSVSGEAAKFLVGGEFPVPVAQDDQGRVTVDFKPFGVGLGFTPVVLSSGRISLKISTEVSELSNIGALQLTSTLTLPALSVRRAEDTVEMQSGSSMMIAGLLQQKYKQSLDSVPGLTSLPILGSLFRSRDFLNEETELVIIVTPYIVQPGAPGDYQTPADNLEAPNDMQAVFMGRLNKVIKARKGELVSNTSSPEYSAPVGYVIE